MKSIGAKGASRERGASARTEAAAPFHRVALTRRDIIVFEQRLKEAVQALFPFKAYSIHFPRVLQSREAERRPDEDKILLPLALQGSLDPRVLGVFVARGADQEQAAPLLSRWPALAHLIADNLLQYKRSLCDPVTALFSRHYLLERMAREIDSLRCLPSQATGEAPPAGVHPADEGLVVGADEMPRRASLGVLAIRFAALRDVVREFGYQFADELMIALADAFTPLCPEQALAARTGDFEFALHLPAATATECHKLACDISSALRAVSLVHPLRHARVGIAATVGFALYPRDMSGDIFLRSAAEQARLLLRKARLAAALADEERPFLSGPRGDEAVLPFNRILAEGGRVLEVLPLSRVVVSLGSHMHAREGQRFSIWSVQYPIQAMDHPAGSPGALSPESPAPLYKGELVLMEIQESVSQAEIISLGEPTWAIEPGDRLFLLPEEQSNPTRLSCGQDRYDAATGFLRHGDFFAHWAQERENCDSFTLALIRFGTPAFPDADPADPAVPPKDPPATGSLAQAALSLLKASPLHPEGARHAGRFMAQAARLCCDEFGAKILGGRYSLNSLILFHPHMDGPCAKTAYQKLAALLQERLGLDIAVGLACHPYLNFRKADAPENCQKALEYALLLPAPQVGLLDSLALNISADKLFSQGDLFSAIKEYQMALLADEGNGMAWNSLGICLATLGRQAEAERHFSKALVCNPDDVMALYNLGYMYQSRNQADLARSQYQQCLVHAPRHLFASLRLGQLAELAGDHAAARQLYEKAAALPGGYPLTCRHFARLCLSEGKPDQAREYLHEALLHDPQDALSLQLLSRLSLDAGEDPDMAVSLARQSVSLCPGLKAGWLDLARALQALGKNRQARDARLRAGGS
jgi:tetratricopeptide (TPR) repeat protein/GGDEF domain-containing protein